MKSTPKISLVTACLNQGEFIGAAIESVLSSCYPNLEYIIRDGGSTDGTLDVILKYGQAITSWTSEADSGHYDAVNKGFSETSGEIMGFLNSDDKLFPGALQVIGEVFATHPDVDWITSLLPAAWDVAGHCIDVTPLPGFSKVAFLDGRYGGVATPRWFIQQESTFWRRSLWEKAGGTINLAFSHAGDFDLWRRFYAHADLIGVKALIGGFRIREGQRVSQDTVYADQSAAILDDARKRIGWHANVIRSAVVGRGFETVSGAGKVIRHVLGYPGYRIVRCKPGSRTARWNLESHYFL